VSLQNHDDANRQREAENDNPTSEQAEKSEARKNACDASNISLRRQAEKSEARKQNKQKRVRSNISLRRASPKANKQAEKCQAEEQTRAINNSLRKASPKDENRPRIASRENILRRIRV